MDTTLCDIRYARTSKQAIDDWTQLSHGLIPAMQSAIAEGLHDSIARDLAIVDDDSFLKCRDKEGNPSSVLPQIRDCLKDLLRRRLYCAQLALGVLAVRDNLPHAHEEAVGAARDAFSAAANLSSRATPSTWPDDDALMEAIIGEHGNLISAICDVYARDRWTTGYVRNLTEILLNEQVRQADADTSIRVLFVDKATEEGLVGTLRMELLPDGHGDIYPRPDRTAFQLDEKFRSSIRVAVAAANDLGAALSDKSDIRWHIDWEGGSPGMPLLEGGSLGTAFAAGMYCLLVDGHFPDQHVAVSATLDAQTRSLGRVDGIEAKIKAAEEAGLRQVIVADNQMFKGEIPELCLPLDSLHDTVNALTVRLSDTRQILTVVCLAVSQQNADPGTPDVHELTTQIMKDYEAYPRHTPSGGILALFGVPSVKASDPRRAVVAVTKAREELERYGAALTAGIATNDATPSKMRFGVLAEGDDDPTHSMATRLLYAAAAGEIVLAPSTYSCVRHMCDATPISTDAAPGDTPYVLKAVRPHTPESPSSLVGRQRELTDLTMAYDAVLDGVGQIVTITGEAGMGKSRLLVALKEYVRDRGDQALWLLGRVDDLGANFAKPYGSFVDAFDALEERLADGAQDQPPPIHEILRQMREDRTISEPSESDTAHTLSAALGLTTVGDQNAEENQRAAAAVRDFVLALVNDRPVVMVLEDLHGADRLTRDMILYLAETTVDLPLMIVCAYRPYGADADSLRSLVDRRGFDEHTHIDVGPLRSRDAESLIRELLPQDPRREALLATILAKIGGNRGERNPLLIHSLVGLLRDQGKIYQEAGSEQWRISDDIDNIELPETIQLVIQERLGLLEEQVRFLLRDASAIGLSFRRDLLQKIVRPESEPFDSIDLPGAGRFVRADLGAEYSFYHALMHESVYRTIQPEKLEQLHADIGAAIELLQANDLELYYEDLAHHYEKTPDHAKAIYYLDKAASKALMKGDAPRALALAHKAKRRAEDNDFDDFGTHQSLCRTLAWSHYWLSQPHEMVEVAEEGAQRVAERFGRAVTEIREPEAAAAIEVLALAHLRSGTAHGREQHGRLSQVLLDGLAHMDYSPMLRTAYVRVVDYCTITRQYDKAWEWIAIFEQKAWNDPAGLARAMSLRGARMASSGQPLDAIEDYKKAVPLYQVTGDAKQEALRHLYMGLRYRMVGELEDSKTSLGTATEMLDEQGDKRYGAEAHASLGTTLLCMGDTNGARDSYTMAANMRGHQNSDKRVWAQYHLACVSLAEGDYGSAQHALLETLRLPYMYRPTKFRLGMNAQMALVLAALETTYQSPQEFQDLCRRTLAAQHSIPQELRDCQWHLTPTKPRSVGHRHSTEDFSQHPIDSPWRWVDPLQDCSYQYDDGLHIYSANCRNLIPRNRTAPRVLRMWDGDIAMEVTCESVDARPTIGGLLLWIDERNYMGLKVGDHSPQSVALTGCIDGRDGTIGRGCLPAGGVRLRLERIGCSIRGLCSSNGCTWFQVGEADLPPSTSIEAGLMGNGRINRTVYRGTFPQGTAIRFTPLETWQP